MSNVNEQPKNPEVESNNWYKIVRDDTLEQGDILEGVKVIVPTYEFLMGKTDEVTIKEYNVIILTQSCDLENKKTKWVHVSPILPLSQAKAIFSQFREDIVLESVRRGHQPKFHMIAECDIETHHREISIIDFRNVFALPYKYVAELVKEGKERRRMNSPYKEHLGQAYARFYMRVGLPNDIPKFVDRLE